MGLKVILHSNAPWVTSGYGTQGYQLAKRMQKMPEVEQLSYSCFYGLHGGIVEYDGIICIPPRAGDWGNNCLQLHSYHTNSDVVIGLQDTWVLRQDIAQLGFLWCPWVPIDHDPLPDMIHARVSTAYMAIAMAKFGEHLMLESGMKNVRYAPHAIDTKQYKPHSEAVNKVTRKKLGFPEDIFLIGIVAANKGYPARKNWPQLLEALSVFFNMHKDAYLYAHTLTTTEDQGVDLIGMIQRWGMGDRILFPNPYLYLQGFPAETMSEIYSCMDVFVLPTGGGGFEIPLIEAQACGTPVVTMNFTAMPELVAPGTGGLIRPGYKWYTPLYSYQALPNIDDIIANMEHFYQMNKKERKRQSKAVREFVVANYDADYVANKYWHPIIQELDEATQKRKLKLAAV